MSKIKLKNNIDTEFSIEHIDDTQAISVSSVDMSKVKSVDTISDLKALQHTPPTVWVSGYHTKGDGAFGSHIFEWDATSTEDDNKGTIIKLDSITTGRYKLKYDGSVNVKWFGAKSSNTFDIVPILSYCVENFDSIIIDRKYYVLSGFTSEVEKNVEIIGLGNGEIVYNGALGSVYTRIVVKSSGESTLSVAPLARDNSITVVDASSFSVGDLVSISSTETGESGWNYKKNDTGRIVGITENTITLGFSLNFDYDITTNTVTVKSRKPYLFKMSNMKFSGTESMETKITGFSNVIIDKVSGYGELGTLRNTGQFLVPNICTDVKLSNIYAEKIAYPMLPLSCRGVSISNITTNNVRHTLDAGSFSSDIRVSNVSARDNTACLGYHPSFNVHISNITAVNEHTAIGFRTCGGSISDLYISYDESVTDIGTTYMQQIAFQGMTIDPYTYNNVSYTNIMCKPNKNNQQAKLQIGNNQSGVVTGCNVSNVFVSGNGSSIVNISNSNLVAVRARGHILNVDNCIFYGSGVETAINIENLYTGVTNQPILKVSNTDFKNYSKIVGKDVTPTNQKTFSNCSFTDVSVEFYNTLYPDNSHLYYGFVNCVFSNVSSYSNNSTDTDGIKNFAGNIATNGTPDLPTVAP